MATNSSNSSLHSLQSLFPGAFSIDGKALAQALGIAEKTIRNQGDAFPIRPVRIGRRKLYRLQDVAAFLDAQLGIAGTESAAEVSQPRRRGPARKMAGEAR